MPPYRVTQDYTSYTDGARRGPYTAGATVEVTTAEAEWINRDAPGTLKPDRPARTPAAAPADPAAVPTGNVSDLLAWVGDDRDKATRALAAEQAKPRPRAGVVEPLTQLLVVDPATVPDGTVDELLAWVGDDVHRASAALDVEQDRAEPRTGVVEPLQAMLRVEPST